MSSCANSKASSSTLDALDRLTVDLSRELSGAVQKLQKEFDTESFLYAQSRIDLHAYSTARNTLPPAIVFELTRGKLVPKHQLTNKATYETEAMLLTCNTHLERLDDKIREQESLLSRVDPSGLARMFARLPAGHIVTNEGRLHRKVSEQEAKSHIKALLARLRSAVKHMGEFLEDAKRRTKDHEQMVIRGWGADGNLKMEMRALEALKEEKWELFKAIYVRLNPIPRFLPD